MREDFETLAAILKKLGGNVYTIYCDSRTVSQYKIEINVSEEILTETFSPKEITTKKFSHDFNVLIAKVTDGVCVFTLVRKQ
jgi:hypothetical protein